MAQLIVRRLEEVVVQRLREEAASYGISMEEAHRRILRRSLLGDAEAPGDLKEYLRSIPKGGDDEEELFERQKDGPREVEL
ncbi:MAG: DNA-binding protein [Akkermansiaceae bacterium]|nr:DNA-binding protein [Akkermansiaceae bacterium]NNM28696.1 DNA-binding protein [Akkermansiaceae bacterium]